MLRALFERAHAAVEIDRRTYRGNGGNRQVGRLVQFARQPDGEIPAERVPGDDERPEPIVVLQHPQHCTRIGRQARVIEPRRQVFGVAAIPLVERHRIPAPPPRLCCEPAHVVHAAGAFEPVKREQCRPRAPIRLPVTMRKHLGVGGDAEQARFRVGQGGERPRSRPRHYGHHVAVRQPAPRAETVRGPADRRAAAGHRRS